MKRALVELFTGRDNATLDLGKFLWAKMSLTFVVLTAALTWMGHSVSLTEWAVGAGTILGAGAVATKVKETTEPSPGVPS
jgi:hypothetical protein